MKAVKDWVKLTIPLRFLAVESKRTDIGVRRGARPVSIESTGAWLNNLSSTVTRIRKKTPV